MIRALLAATVTAVVLCPTAALADVEVVPDSYAPELHLSAHKVLPAYDGHSSGAIEAPGSKPKESVSANFTPCRVDPETGLFGCRTPTPQDPATPDDPELTEGDILNAVREIGLPSLQVRIQPNDEMLVNIDTIFYTEPQPFERSVELLGFDIDLQATPVSYQWVHGDGTVRSTTRPGRPYPEMDVTHRYREPTDGVRARVDVTYRVRFRVDDGPWQALSQTLIASGPVAELDVKEAAPVLTKP